MLALLAAITIAVNDRPLDVAAVEDRGRIIVPMRSLFEALGAAVQYDGSSRRITASTDTRHVSFAIGEDGSRVIGNRTYVPLRFVSESLGAQVDYDTQTQLVTVRTDAAQTQVAVQTRAVASPQPVVALAPPSGAREATAFPTITANIDAPMPVKIATLHVTVDGRDVTPDASYGGTSVTYIPRHGLAIGTHRVEISGTLTNGKFFNQQWSFETTVAALQSNGPATNDYGSPGALQLSVAGSTFEPNQYMPIQLIAPPGGQAFAFVCNSPWQYPLSASPYSSYYSATLQAPWGAQISQCPITAMYIGPNGQVFYAPYPVYVTFQPAYPYQTQWPQPQTPAPVPSATPMRMRPGPTTTRAPEVPMPQPATASTPAPSTITTHPMPRPIYRPPVHIIPRPMPVRTTHPLGDIP